MAKLVLLRPGQSEWNKKNLFTGWVDVDITEKGRGEAESAAVLLKDFNFAKAYTSELKRAQHTLKIVLEKTGQTGIPVEKDKALNERSYGDLQGKNKAETAEKYGKEQVHIWRRSFDVRPPGGESLKDTLDRVLPYSEDNIVPDLKAGKDILISAHGNSLRAIIMVLDKISETDISNLNLGTGIPIVYTFDADMKILSKEILEPKAEKEEAR